MDPLMNAWIVKTLREIFPGTEIKEQEIDLCLHQLKGHSLKMVTFLARFAREFGRGPRILDFIASPTLATLTKPFLPSATSATNATSAANMR
jgi:hypothetical protein